ncbi:hypothetical protein FN846DRAFT_903363 [Sphaerosporella brunnea]|uniref:Uncharacterized protein n=1 Tax=Sphaerosporella brunnea TaxID=1250544 RepID=A0A5J5F7H6_9PEZI|nr:hypothetical protein FN846DRAFT_903363 [Sphaerosporella brunnea]
MRVSSAQSGFERQMPISNEELGSTFVRPTWGDRFRALLRLLFPTEWVREFGRGGVVEAAVRIILRRAKAKSAIEQAEPKRGLEEKKLQLLHQRQELVDQQHDHLRQPSGFHSLGAVALLRRPCG